MNDDPIRAALRTPLVWLIILAATTILCLVVLLKGAQAESFNNALRADSTAAAADVSRRLTDARVQRVLGDSTAAWTRRVVQQKQRADSLDAALKWERKTRTGIDVAIEEGRGTDTSAVTSDSASDVRAAHFDVAAGVFSVSADVTLPPAPQAGTMSARVTAPPIPLDVRLGCGESTGGVRRADVVVTAPEWVTVGIKKVESAVNVCNDAARQKGLRVPWWSLPIAALGAVLLAR